MVNREWKKADFYSNQQGVLRVFTIYHSPLTIHHKEI